MKDSVSALVDGELDEQDCNRVFDSLRGDAELRARWSEYQMIGDVLRGESSGSVDFLPRVMAELAHEPIVLAPAASRRIKQKSLSQMMLPVAASVMGVLAVGWVAQSMFGAQETNVSLASVAAPLVSADGVRPSSATVDRAASDVDPRREYVFVHQAMNGGGPISGAVQYVRTVSDTQGDLRR